MNNKQYVGRRVSSVEVYDEIGPITGVALLLDEESEILAGDDTGYVLEVNCPYGTQEMADNILAKLAGRTYKGFRAQGAELDPTAELGDGLTVDGNYSMLAYRNVKFGPGHQSEIAAPGESALEHEFSYQSPSKRETNRKINRVRRISLQGIVLIEKGLAEGTTVINGGCLMTGKIQDRDGLNYWDLDNGVLVLNNTEIDGTGGRAKFTNCPIYTIASKVWKSSDYTQDDITTLTDIIMRCGNEGYTPTTAELDRYDFDLDGELIQLDLLYMSHMIDLGVDITSAWKLQIDPADKDAMIKVWREYDGPNGMGTIVHLKTVVHQVGMTEVFAKNLRAFGDLTLQGYDVPKIVVQNPYTGDKYTGCHTGNTGLGDLGISDLTASSSTATASYPVGTVGFHVYGYTVSGASKVGMFIPLSLCDGTSFQLADDGNYVTFTMTADTSAETLTITRTGGAGWITSVHPLYFGATT